MKRLINLCIIVVMLSGCAVQREMQTTLKVKDGQYGIAKGKGHLVYESKTAWSLFCKQMPVPEAKECMNTKPESPGLLTEIR